MKQGAIPQQVAVDLSGCDTEPIHLSGHVQPHGLLLAVTEPGLVVVHASANCDVHLGVAPERVLGQDLAQVLGQDPVRRLQAVLVDPRASGTDALALRLPHGVRHELTWHRSGGLVVLELEPIGEEAPATMAGVFAHVWHALRAMETADGVPALCDVAAWEVRQATGYDRVMVCKFHPDGDGEVVAESHHPDLEPFLGLRYPATDIPAQARRLYLLNRLRVVVDVAYEPVPLLTAGGLTGETLDLGMASLRIVSPVHLTYLTSMGVGATLTISLMRGTTLWGMLACHHRTPRRVDAQLRAACRVLSQTFSLQLVAREAQERHDYRSRLLGMEVALVAQMSSADSLTAALLQADPLPLELTGADGLVAHVDGRTVTLGATPPPEAADALLQLLRDSDDPGGLVCDDLPRRFPQLAAHAELASGVLAVPLSAAFEDYLIWFRGERTQQITWAGRPDQDLVGGTPGAIGLPHSPAPRQSFEAWTEQVRGTSTPWRRAEVDTARGLAAAAPELLLARTRDRLAHLAMHDQLTGLPNRALLMDRAEHALKRRYVEPERVALMFVDLDRFKLVNDSMGHAAGDELLRQTAARLGALVRAEDTVARIGGDEFVVLCEGIPPAQAERLAEHVVQAFRTPFLLAGREAFVTASVGLAVTIEDTAVGAAELLGNADTAMYQAKHASRDAWARFTEQMRVVSLRGVEIATQLRPAFARGDLQVHYQPIYTTAGVLRGFEALCRWPLAGRGMVPPSEFIPVAESTGLIGRLTGWVLEAGLAALAVWRRRRPELDLVLAVNVSAAQVGDHRLRQTIDDALARNDLPAAALCLEITEGALLDDDGRVRDFLQQLRQIGVRLSVDDFGTGFSSLSYLTRLPVHELKIDRAFVAGLPDSSGDVVVVQSVVALAHRLGLDALAEGVETEEQLTELKRLGCDLVQGYLLGRPVDADAVGHLLGSRRPRG